MADIFGFGREKVPTGEECVCLKDVMLAMNPLHAHPLFVHGLCLVTTGGQFLHLAIMWPYALSSFLPAPCHRFSFAKPVHSANLHAHGHILCLPAFL
jgi:hypothetical protein